AELRALQDLRYQGPEPEHHLGAAAGWRGAGLPEYVKAVAGRVGRRREVGGREGSGVFVVGLSRGWPQREIDYRRQMIRPGRLEQAGGVDRHRPLAEHMVDAEAGKA